jgi:uncharacterized repeat protein (TIGR01451 family)
MNQHKSQYTTSLPQRLGTGVAALLFWLIPSLVISQGSPVEPAVKMLPLPQSLMAPQPQQHNIQPDPRASELTERLVLVLEELKRSSSASVVSGRHSRSVLRSQSQKAPIPDRKEVSQAVPTAVQAYPTVAGVASTRLLPKLGDGGTVRSLTAGPNSFLQPHVRSNGAAESDEETARTFFRAQKALMAIAKPDEELRLRSRQLDTMDHRHLRFEQQYRNVPIWKSEVIAQLDRAGNLITISGAYAPTPRKLVTKPALTTVQAEQIAANMHFADSGSIGGSRLVIFAKASGRPRLAWEVEVQDGLLNVWNVLVDAHNGSVLTSISLIQADNVAGSGIDLFGDEQALSVWDDAGTHYMFDTTKMMFDPASDPPPSVLARGVVVVLDALNQPPSSNPDSLPVIEYVAAGSPSGPWLPDAVSAAVNLSAAYDYFLTTHQRNSLNDEGGNLVAIVRVGQGMANALFDSSTQTMYFGDAQPYAGSLDVIAHELTHGIVATSAGLVYQGQSGALNEAFSDIFGEMVEASVVGQPDWLIGSRLDAPLRNLASPGAIQCGATACPSRMSEYVVTAQDHGGVHTNSSIINHAFYLLAEGLPGAIGTTDAALIFYRALTTKLSPQSEFIDARFAAIQSAEELFGAGSLLAEKTAEAFDAIELFDSPSNSQPSPFPGNGGQDATLFLYWDDATSRYLLGRQDPAFSDPAQGIQLSVDAVNPARLSVSGDGTLAVFVNAQQDVCLISTDGSTQEACVGFPGTVASVAMAPDGQTFGFVFLDGAGNPDNQISIINLDTSETRTFELVAPVFDGTTNVEVLSADAMDFTADNRFLVYDAFNELHFVDDTSLGLWSIYAIDLLTGGTFAIAPPSPGFEIAFPAVAQTSDSHIVFDIFDSAISQNFVITGNVYTGQTAVVDTTNDFSVPSYVGDDTGIVYSVQDATMPTGYSLWHRSVTADRVTPTGAATVWLADADYGAVYRQGSFTGPVRVDLSVTQNTITEAGHRAAFRIDIFNQGPDSATDVEVTDTLPDGVDILDVSGPGSCSVNDTAVQCSIAEIPPSATESIEVQLQLQNIVSITNTVTAFATQPDLNTTDNTSFANVDSADLNISPTSSSIADQTATQGSAFTLNISSTFSDADDDPLTFGATGLPSSLTINSASGIVSGTPNAADGAASPYAIEVTAADPTGASASESFNLTVNAPPSTPNGGDTGGGGGGGSVGWTTLLWIFSMLLLNKSARFRLQERKCHHGNL